MLDLTLTETEELKYFFNKIEILRNLSLIKVSCKHRQASSRVKGKIRNQNRLQTHYLNKLEPFLKNFGNFSNTDHTIH